MPLFERFVEPGRLCRIAYGSDTNKMCTIIDIVDEKRVVVDGPNSVTGVMRQPIPLKWLNLTDMKVELKRGAKEKALKKAMKDEGVMDKWKASAWARRSPSRRRRPRCRTSSGSA